MTEQPILLLIAGIVKQALIDRHDRRRSVREDATAFFSDGRLTALLDGTGLDAGTVRARMQAEMLVGTAETSDAF